MARIYDNIEVKFEEGLQGIVTAPGVERVDFCVGYFNLRGWDRVMDQIDSLPGGFVFEGKDRLSRICRLLIGMHRPQEELIRQLYSGEEFIPDSEYVLQCKIKIAKDFREQLRLGLPTRKDEETLRRLSRQLKKKMVCVKLYLRTPLHAKLYLAHRPTDPSNKIIGIMGSSNLTYSGFKGQGELNADFTDSDHTAKLAKWFNERWNDRLSLDITDELVKVIDESWASEKEIPPYYIYLKTAYHLSQEARSGIQEFSLTPQFRNELFDFQQTAVKITARHLSNDKRGGAMIGDVVGLGKTITACAIAKIYEMAYAATTLVICPANLQEMWRKYVEKYDLKADIQSMAKEIDIEGSRVYRLVIIDESHNLRNGSRGKRYANIKNLIEHLDCPVLLLSATPYNKHFEDLSNQLRLFLSDDQDLGIRPEEYIRRLGGERGFMRDHGDVFIRSIKAFEKSPYVEDWNELMKLFLVRRTRTFIKENYAETDETDGRKYLRFNDGTRSYFPDRIPKAIKFKTENGDQYSRLYSAEMISNMERLQLPRYGLAKYINEKDKAEATAKEKQLIENLSRAGMRMQGFCKSTFFKRMDSSGLSFLLTLYRHVLRNMVVVHAIEKKLPIPVSDENQLPDEYIDDEDINITLFGPSADPEIKDGDTINIPDDLDFYRRKAQEYYHAVEGKKNLEWLKSGYFKRTLKQHLLADSNTILGMIKLCGSWSPHEDQKLKSLEDILGKKHPDEKILVFTQYSDTATYIYRQLKKRGFADIARVTGGTENPTAVVERFSPESNRAEKITPLEEVRVLVATDVLSEGQNLQDSHVIVNYDLPWAIIRLIQRAGRVDRIGQKENRIFCYSFFPAEGVDAVINLRKRLNDRINEAAKVIGGDEVFFEGNEQNLRDMFNEKAGILDEEDDGDVDLSSMAYQIWKNATDKNPKLKQIIPSLANIVYTAKEATASQSHGVITYARTHNDFDVLTWLDKDGNLISQSQKQILDALACEPKTPAIPPLENHLDLVGKTVKNLASQTETMIGGALGKTNSIRYRLFVFLNDALEHETDLFYSDSLKQSIKLAINDIYNFPLFESAKSTLSQMLRNNKGQLETGIVDQILELRRTGALCRIPEGDAVNKDPTIICSMGLASKTSHKA